MDLFGLIAYISIDGSKYCLVIVDDYSRFTWVFLLQEKSHTQETLKGFLRRAQNGGATYEITVKNPDHVCHGVKSVTVDGKAVDSNVIPVFGNGTHKVEVVRLRVTR